MEREDTARGRPAGRVGVADVLRDWSEGLCFVTRRGSRVRAHDRAAPAG